jgi:hypothetical protein
LFRKTEQSDRSLHSERPVTLKIFEIGLVLKLRAFWALSIVLVNETRRFGDWNLSTSSGKIEIAYIPGQYWLCK